MIQSSSVLEAEVAADGSGSEGHGTGQTQQQPEVLSPRRQQFWRDVAEAERRRRSSHSCDHGAGAAHC